MNLSQFFDSLSVILTLLFSRLIYILRLLVMLRFFTHAITKILIFSNLLILAINIIQSFFNSFSIIIHSRFQQIHKLTFNLYLDITSFEYLFLLIKIHNIYMSFLYFGNTPASVPPVLDTSPCMKEMLTYQDCIYE